MAENKDPEGVDKKGKKLDEDGKVLSDSEKKKEGFFERIGATNYSEKNKEAVYSWGRD